MSQTDRLLRWLQEVGPINPMDAWRELGIYRLGARAYDLRQAGFDVKSRIKPVKNGHGETFHVAEYSL